MARLTLEQALRVAELSALHLDRDEAEALCGDLGSVLEHMAALERVDVSGVEPTFHPVAPSCTLRNDVAVPSLPREALLAAAPASEQGGFAVPRVLDGDG
jgi:aspartyl-tRNA(Asn)/glutamyl-tRNA(Gln) amidotransferase subunit C